MQGVLHHPLGPGKLRLQRPEKGHIPGKRRMKCLLKVLQQCGRERMTPDHFSGHEGGMQAYLGKLVVKGDQGNFYIQGLSPAFRYGKKPEGTSNTLSFHLFQVRNKIGDGTNGFTGLGFGSGNKKVPGYKVLSGHGFSFFQVSNGSGRQRTRFLRSLHQIRTISIPLQSLNSVERAAGPPRIFPIRAAVILRIYVPAPMYRQGACREIGHVSGAA